MTHGPAKRRDIARSVLPSKDRKAARRKLAAVKRRSRRDLRHELRGVGRGQRAESVVAEYDGAPFDPRGYPSGEIRRAVNHRRGADKLGPVFCWAKATTRDLPVEDRLPAVRGLLAGSLAGRHALGHLASDDHFRGPDVEWSWWDMHVAVEDHFDPRPELRAVARRVLEHGRHAELNQALKASPNRHGEVRVLLGPHDVDAFVDAIARNRTWRGLVLGFRWL